MKAKAGQAPFDGSFEAIKVETANVRLTLDWEGEGWNGDYDGADSKDAPLLRFTAVHKTEKDRFFEGDYKAESYCTALDARRPREELVREAQGICDRFEAEEGNSWKKVAQEQSWAGAR